MSDKEEEEKIIHPDNIYKEYWDYFLGLFVYISIFMYSFRPAFYDTFNVSTLIIDVIIDSFFGFDFILIFFTAYYDAQGNPVFKKRKIRNKYLKSNYFITDILGNLFILDYLLLIFDTNFKIKANNKFVYPIFSRVFKILKTFRFFKILSNPRCDIFLNFLRKCKIRSSPEKLIKFIFNFLFSVHVCSCMFYFLAILQRNTPNNWVFRLGFVDKSIFELYLISYHWTLTTITTVGYGDVSSGTTLEKIFNLFVMSIGVMMYSFAIGALSSIVASFQAKSEELTKKKKYSLQY